MSFYDQKDTFGRKAMPCANEMTYDIELALSGEATEKERNCPQPETRFFTIRKGKLRPEKR
jgi:hypothetical protein